MLDSLNKLINTENKMEEEEIKKVEAEAKSLKLKQQQEEMKNAEISEEDQTILDIYYESLHRPQILEIKSKAENDNASFDDYLASNNSLAPSHDHNTNNDDSLTENDLSNHYIFSNNNSLAKEFTSNDIPTTTPIAISHK